MAYRAEIEIGVKGVKQLDKFQSQLERLSNEVDRVNKKKFTVANLSSYNEALRKANENLSQTEIETNKAGKATGLYKRNLDAFVTALLTANDAQTLNNKLVKEEIDGRNAAARAIRNQVEANIRLSKASRQASNFSLDFDPAIARSIARRRRKLAGDPSQYASPAGPAPSELQGQSSLVAERLTQQLRDQEQLQASLLGLENKSNTAAKERLRLSTELQESLTNITIAAKNSIKIRASEQGKINTQIIREGVLRDGINDSRAEQILLAQRAEKTEQRINAVLKRRKGLEEDARRRRRLSEDLALGAGFPLLFGGGAGSVLGGVAGAAVGGGKGGFGAQILFSAIGQQIDQLAESAKELGKALSPLTADLDAVLEAAGTLNSESGILARRLKEAGQEQLALSVATEDLSRIVGTDGVNALREFGSETSELNLAIKQLVLDVQVGIARLAKAATNFTGSVDERQVRQSVEQARGLIRSGEASPELVAAFNKRASGTDLSGAFGAITDNEKDIVRLVEEQSKTRIDGLKAAAEQAEQIDGAASAARGTRANRASIASYRRQGEILSLGNDLLNERVVALKREDIIAKSNLDTLELQSKLQENGLSAAEKVQINTAIANRAAQKTNELNQLDLEVRRAVTKESDKTTKSTAKDQERLQQKLATLEQERQNIREISNFKDRIAAAEAVSDSQLVIRLKGEQRIAQIESKRLTDLTNVTDQRLIDAINITATTKKLAEQRETERQLGEDQRKRQELFSTTIEDLQHQLSLAQATSQAERDRLNIAKELKSLQEQGLKDDQLLQISSIMEQLAAAKEPLNAFITKATEDLNNLQQVAVDISQGIGNALGDSFVNGLQSLVSGAASIKQVFANLLKSVAKLLANTAAKMIAQYIAIGVARMFAGIGGGFNSVAASPGGAAGVAGIGGGGLGDVFGNTSLFQGFANGGRPPVGKPSIVGERGPELFVPRSSGTIVPNHALGGSANVTVNVDASGSSVEGNENDASQLGKAIGIAVQQELIKQKRPGGLLTR